MRKVILSLVAITATSVAVPSLAQNQHNYQNQGSSYANDNVSVRIRQLDTRLQDGVRRGSITRREARPIRLDIQRLSYLERQYGANGLTGQERATLQQRIRTVRQQIRRADDGAQGQYAEWDREDGYAWGASNRGRVDANNDGWDDRDYNRNGRWDDEVNYGRIDANNDSWDDRDYNRNGRWDDDVNYGYQQPAPRTGIAGVIDSVLGVGGLQVGQRAPADLYGVPYQYQAEYRDGNGVYYRSDGRNIYQVDARSQTIVRIIRI